MTAAWRLRLGPLLLLLPALAGGCGPTPPRLAPVQGRVTYRGQPVVHAAVEFTPDAAKGTRGPSSAGGTGSDGVFRLRCPPYGAGAVVGHHRVTVTAYPGSAAVPSSYANPATTRLCVEVPPGGLEGLELKLEDD